jgi:hypothetical protein
MPVLDVVNVLPRDAGSPGELRCGDVLREAKLADPVGGFVGHLAYRVPHYNGCCKMKKARGVASPSEESPLARTATDDF